MAMNDKKVTSNDAGQGEKDILGPEPELDVSEMTKGHTGMKLLVVGMGVAILIMIFLIAMKSMEVLVGDGAEETSQKGEAVKTAPATNPRRIDMALLPKMKIAAPAGATLISSSLSSQRLTLTYQVDSSRYLVQVLDLRTGKLVSEVEIN